MHGILKVPEQRDDTKEPGQCFGLPPECVTSVSSRCRVQGAGHKVQGIGCRAQGAGCWVQDTGYMVQGTG